MDLITYALCRKLIKRAVESLGDIFTLKGNVDSVESLPSTGNNPGDIYLVGPNQDGSYDEYYWTSNGEWEIMGSTGPGFDGVITELTLYKGEDGTGTIENPAEGTILDVVNSKVLKTKTWGNQNWENGTIEIVGTEPVEKIAYRNELCADANPRIPSDPEYNENDNLENYWDTPWHFIEWLQKWDQNEGLYNYFSAIEQEGTFTYDPTQKTIEPTTGLNMSWITDWNEDYGFSAAIHNGNNSFITEAIHIEKGPETEDWVLVYGEGFYLFDGRQVKLTNGENEFFIDNSEKSDYILKELEKFDEDEFVKKSGDTMTGKLIVPTLSVGNSNTVNEGCVGEGDHVQAMNINSHAEGYYTYAHGKNSHAEGDYSTASGEDAHAEGYTTVAQGNYSHSEGNGTDTLSKSQHVQGEWNIQDHSGTVSTRGTYAHIVGNGTSENARSNAHTLDWSGNAWFAGDIYIGSTSGTNKDSGSKKLATDDIFGGTNGTNTGTKGLVPAPTASDTDKYLKSDGTWATVSGGSGNYVSKTGDTMTGTLTTPNIIVGNQKNSTTLGTKASIFGRDGTASGNFSIVEGDGCTAKDEACHAEGRNCIAGAGGSSGDYAHAEGCETKATGFCSHSEGYYTTASEYYAHAEGEKTVAAGTHSHAEGYGTKANRGFTHVQGVYNILDDTGSGSSKGTYAHIVGNGSADNNRKNIHTIKWTGEAWFQGDVYVGSTGGKNKDEGSKKLATEEYVRNLLQEFATLNNLNMPE